MQRARTFADCGIRAGDRVLELGAGTGFWTAALCDHVGPGGHVYAQDVQRGMIERMTRRTQRTNMTPLLCNSVTIPLSDGALDAVFAAYVFEEIDREGLMHDTAAELARLVRDGGALGVREHRWGVSVSRVRTIFATLTRAGFACDEVTSSRFSFAARFTRRPRGASGEEDAHT